jgi:hypothetical protein
VTLLSLPLVGCLSNPTNRDTETPEPANSANGTTSPDVDRLAEPLPGLLAADDRAAFAADHGLEYRDGAVSVVIRLEPGADLPEEYVVSVTTRRDGIVFAFVAVDDLEPLASDERVRLVGPPSEPAATGGA